jgi:hypothetical protein
MFSGRHQVSVKRSGVALKVMSWVEAVTLTESSKLALLMFANFYRWRGRNKPGYTKM